MPSAKRAVFGTRLGFYLAAVGSAFGLGNLWRFPYVVAENGGGAFVLLYLALVFILGMPFLIAELALGKISRGSLVPALSKLMGERYMVREIRQRDWSGLPVVGWLIRRLGAFSLMITVVVLAYYAVISGWVLHFFMQLLVAVLRGSEFHPEGSLSVLLHNGWLQVALTSAHLLIVSVIVAKDLEIGLEKWVGYVMPGFGLLLAILVIQSLQMESAGEALRFLFYPNFAKLSLASVGQAVGHVLFTLSVGFGTMVTFGSYLREKVYIPMAGFRVCMMDSMISIWAGAMIFPLVLIGGSTSPPGPELLFQTVPRLLERLPGGLWFGVLFFACLYLASLGASIGLFETVVANWREVRRVPRPRGAATIAALCFVLAVGPALSSSVLRDVRLGDHNLLQFLDSALINWCLPIAALLVAQVVTWTLKRDLVAQEFLLEDQAGGDRIFRHWLFLLQYIAIPVVLAGLVLQIWSIF
ncbi:MAG: sodium-dependent transporter [Bdellovibrionales bacterium]